MCEMDTASDMGEIFAMCPGENTLLLVEIVYCISSQYFYIATLYQLFFFLTPFTVSGFHHSSLIAIFFSMFCCHCYRSHTF